MICYMLISFLMFIVVSELWEINPSNFLKCMRSRVDFLERK